MNTIPGSLFVHARCASHVGCEYAVSVSVSKLFLEGCTVPLSKFAAWRAIVSAHILLPEEGVLERVDGCANGRPIPPRTRLVLQPLGEDVGSALARGIRRAPS